MAIDEEVPSTSIHTFIRDFRDEGKNKYISVAKEFIANINDQCKMS